MEQSIKGILKLFKNDELQLEQAVKLIMTLIEEKYEGKKTSDTEEFVHKMYSKMKSEFEKVFNSTNSNLQEVDEIIKMVINKVKFEVNKCQNPTTDEPSEDWGKNFEDKIKEKIKNWLGN